MPPNSLFGNFLNDRSLWECNHLILCDSDAETMKINGPTFSRSDQFHGVESLKVHSGGGGGGESKMLDYSPKKEMVVMRWDGGVS